MDTFFSISNFQYIFTDLYTGIICIFIYNVALFVAIDANDPSLINIIKWAIQIIFKYRKIMRAC